MTQEPRGTDSFTLVTQYYPPERGAAQVRLGSIVADLVRRGNRVEVVTALPNYPVGKIFAGWSHRPLQSHDENGAKIRRVWVWASMGSGLGRILNYFSFGVMSVLGIGSAHKSHWVVVEYPTLFGAAPAVVCAKLRRQRVVIIVADLWVDSIVEIGTISDGSLVAFLRWAERAMLRQADAVTAVTEGVRDALLAKGVTTEQMTWLPNGADTEMFSPGPQDPAVRAELGLAAGEHLFLYAGTHGYVHGLEVVLDAAQELVDEPVRFVLVGGGSEKESLQEQAATRGLQNVTFLDPVPPQEVARLLKSCTAGLATVREGDVYRTIRSAKMLPTMASGLPVIYSGDDEGSRLVAAAGAGIVTAPGDGADLAAAVRRIIASPAYAAELGAAGRSWIEAHASWHQLVGTWLDQLHKIDSAGIISAPAAGQGAST
ncbi:MAG: glycosyltransferase family 4 protein [Actinomycetes bacterium]